MRTTVASGALEQLQDVAADEIESDVPARIIELAQAHRTPLTPNIYEVWFAYVTRGNPEVADEVQTLMDAGGVPPARLKELHAERLAQSTLRDDLSVIGTQIAGEMGRLHEQLDDGILNAAQFSETLKGAARQLAGTVPRDELKRLATTLHKSNQAQLGNTQRLGAALGEARARMTAIEQELTELRRTAYTDHLTGLPNRRRFDDALPKAIMEARSTREPMALAMADIDRFKRINDTYGHTAGDNILRRFGQILHDSVKGRDLAARFGGEEFVLIFPDTTLDAAAKLCDRVRTTLERIEWRSQKTDERIGSVSVSFGVTGLRPSDSEATLLARADELLYAAKEAGRNQVMSDA